MCGIAGVIYKDKKSHHIGEALTSMLESLQHRGPDSAGYAIYGSLNFPENYYQLNIEVKRRKGTLDHLKSLLTQFSPIYEEQLIESVGDSDVYKCKISLDEYSLLKPCINEIDELESVRVINGSHSFEMIKDTGKVKDIAERFDVMMHLPAELFVFMKEGMDSPQTVYNFNNFSFFCFFNIMHTQDISAF